MSAHVKVRHRFTGWHNWPEAPEHRGYLANTHRHEFHIEVSVRVDHDYRDIEFHDLKENVAAISPGEELGAYSCEMIARDYIDGLTECYGPVVDYVEVWEDGECGAHVEPDYPAGARPLHTISPGLIERLKPLIDEYGAAGVIGTVNSIGTRWGSGQSS